jgi:hypothetical protein
VGARPGSAAPAETPVPDAAPADDLAIRVAAQVAAIAAYEAEASPPSRTEREPASSAWRRPTLQSGVKPRWR